MEYLCGMVLFAAVWGVFLFWRKDLFWPMVWSGGFFVFVMSAGFVVIKLFWPDIPVERTVVPGYWNPDTLFDLGRRTGGYAIEDALYGFFTAGVATAVYESLFRHKMGRRRAKHKAHLALSAGAFGGFIAVALPLNLIWALIAFSLTGAFVMWYQRPDLIRHSVYGGLSYLVVYVAFFLAFMQLFPDFIPTVYSFNNFLGPIFIGIPLEEYLFAFSFGLLWSPIYEYMHDLR